MLHSNIPLVPKRRLRSNTPQIVDSALPVELGRTAKIPYSALPWNGGGPALGGLEILNHVAAGYYAAPGFPKYTPPDWARCREGRRAWCVYVSLLGGRG